jgi:WD40 repeat protein/class 3 adenylate cyclase/tRNA A-37 threonylcarbamoyl transferase component Bud32/energy-coupling factor transporter ATP-binding protein EcfA2
MSEPLVDGRLLRGRYEVLETLGAGGEARVVKALDHRHERPVALKIRRVRGNQAREELLSEARLLLGLEPHPALPLVREDFFVEDEYVVAMDWVDGTDLARILTERGAPGLAPSSVVAYLAEAAEALTFLHAHDPAIVHGDVKPANLILTRGGHVKLVDFGLSSTPLMLGRRSGTPGYRAPELATGSPPSRASDVYGLAATAFALLTGLPPAGVLPAWEGIDPALADQLEAVVRLGLATDPARRPATPGEFVERLRAGWGATLPTGVTTFCLSDIVGSTELWERDPGAMAEALVRHDELIAAAVESHGGRFLKSKGEGDATFSVFESASDAVAAAIAATRALGAEQWPSGWEMAVRFGIHSGEAERTGADYLGPTVNLAARVRWQADEREILLSQIAADLTAEHLPEGYSLLDLGAHRLRGVEGAQTLHAVAGPGVTAPLPATECPYRGLLAFDADDREFFFGREDVLRSVLERLEPRRLLALVGASGSGKSSLLRAGLIASVDEGEVPGVAVARLLQPGPDPPAEIHGDAATLVVVDQFEELYTLCHDPGARQRFIDALLAHPGPVAIGVRADFYGELSAHPQLAQAVASNQILLGAMSDDDLRRVVTEPARLAGLKLEPGLVDVVLGEVAGEPGALPLLSHALRATWERRDGRTLTMDAYRASGGVTSAVAQSADALVESVPAGERPLLRNVFLRLTELGDGVEDTRRRVPLAELVPQDVPEAAVRALLDRFADARLLTLDERTAEVAHEVLIRTWPTLRGWLEEDREGLRLHRRLGDAARIWEAAGRDPTDLYRGTRLGAALEWAQGHPDALNATERAFLDASVAESDRERRAQIRANRRLRALLAGAGVLLAAAVVAGLLAFRESDNARDSARTAVAQRLGAQALIDDRLDRSLLLAQAGRVLDDTVITRSHLLSALVRPPGAVGVMQGGDPLYALALSPDGRMLATGGESGTLLRFDPRSRRRIGRPIQVDGPIVSLDFSPDGKLLAANAGIGGGREFVRLIDPATGRTVRDIEFSDPRSGEGFGFTDIRFAAGGGTVVVTTFFTGSRAPHPAHVRRFDVRSGRQLGRVLRVGRPDTAAPVVGARRDRLVLTGTAENATYVVDTATLRVRQRLSSGAFTAGLSLDGRRAALGGEDGSVTLLDLRTGKRRRLADRHDGRVQELAFSADGRTLATVGDDGRGLAWDLRRGSVRETLTGHSGRVTHVNVSDDGRTLYTTGVDSRIIVWDIAGDRRLAQPFPGGNPFGEGLVPALAVSPDGRRLAAGLRGGGVRLRDARTLRLQGELPGIEGDIALAVEFSPAGRTMAVTGSGGSVELRDASSGRRIRPPLPGVPPGSGAPRGPNWTPLPASDAQALAFSPDGGRLAVADLLGNVRLLDLRSGRVHDGSRLPTGAISLSYSPDGKLLAVGLANHGTELRDGRSLRVVARLSNGAGEDADRAVRFSPDGRLLAVTSHDGYTQLWDVASRRRAGRRLTGHEGGVIGAEFSPDGRMLATTGFDGAAILWNVASRRALGTLPGPLGWVTPRFTPDGRQLFVLRDSGDAERWEVDPDAWSEHACRVAGRELTRAEWSEFVPDQDYRRVCGS